MIRYLEREEYGACRPLWQEAFPEDSREFGDYYFNKKLLRSRVLVKEDESGRIVTMAHLNPYEVKAGARTWNLDYIVGVATAADSRHQGHMRDVLVRMLLDMHDQGKPFCYLMPASPDIYRPFGFRYIFDQPLWRLRRDAKERMRRERLRLDQPGHSDETAAWLNRWLASRYEVYALRDRSYMEMLQAELCSENGQVYGWFGPEGSLAAMEAFWGRKKQEQRFLYCADDEWLESPDEGETGGDTPAGEERRGGIPGQGKPGRPAIMARITDAAAFVQAIRLDEDCPCSAMDVTVRIHDALIPGNHGLWNWRLDRYGSVLRRERGGGQPGEPAPQEVLVSTETLELTIEQLAGWLFGYGSPEEALEAGGDETPFWLRYIQPLRGVFLDEIV